MILFMLSIRDIYLAMAAPIQSNGQQSLLMPHT